VISIRNVAADAHFYPANQRLIQTRRNQHSQECKNPLQQVFVTRDLDLWLFWPQNKWVSRTHSWDICSVCQVCWS